MPIAPSDSGAAIATRFVERHQARAGFVLDREVECISVRTALVGTPWPVQFRRPSRDGAVPPNDVDALADVLRKYIEDEAYRLQITQNIKEGFVNICDPSVSMQKLSHILHTIKNKQN